MFKDQHVYFFKLFTELKVDFHVVMRCLIHLRLVLPSCYKILSQLIFCGALDFFRRLYHQRKRKTMTF